MNGPEDAEWFGSRLHSRVTFVCFERSQRSFLSSCMSFSWCVCVCVCVCVCDTLYMGMAAGVMYMML